MSTNNYYSGMPTLKFPSFALLAHQLGKDGWRRVTKFTWFRLEGRNLEFLDASAEDKPSRDGDYFVRYRHLVRLEEPLKVRRKELKKIKPDLGEFYEPDPPKEVRKEVEIVHVKRRTICF